MYNEDENKNLYEGLFAPSPDRVEHGVWGTTEIHEGFGSNVEVRKDWYGNVTSVDEGNWFNS